MGGRGNLLKSSGILPRDRLGSNFFRRPGLPMGQKGGEKSPPSFLASCSYMSPSYIANISPRAVLFHNVIVNDAKQLAIHSAPETEGLERTVDCSYGWV